MTTTSCQDGTYTTIHIHYQQHTPTYHHYHHHHPFYKIGLLARTLLETHVFGIAGTGNVRYWNRGNWKGDFQGG